MRIYPLLESQKSIKVYLLRMQQLLIDGDVDCVVCDVPPHRGYNLLLVEIDSLKKKLGDLPHTNIPRCINFEGHEMVVYDRRDREMIDLSVINIYELGALEQTASKISRYYKMLYSKGL